MFFDVVQGLCEKNGLSMSKLALDLKISKSNITNWKNGSCPRADKLEQIAAYFGVSTDYLLGKEQKNKPPMSLSDLTPHELDLIMKLREGPEEITAAVYRLEGVDPDMK